MSTFIWHWLYDLILRYYTCIIAHLGTCQRKEQRISMSPVASPKMKLILGLGRVIVTLQKMNYETKPRQEQILSEKMQKLNTWASLAKRYKARVRLLLESSSVNMDNPAKEPAKILFHLQLSRELCGQIKNKGENHANW